MCVIDALIHETGASLSKARLKAKNLTRAHISPDTDINFLALMNCADTGALAMGVLLLPTTRGAFYLSRELVPATATALGRMPGKLSLRDYHVFGKQLPNPSSVVLIKVHSVNHECACGDLSV